MVTTKMTSKDTPCSHHLLSLLFLRTQALPFGTKHGSKRKNKNEVRKNEKTKKQKNKKSACVHNGRSSCEESTRPIHYEFRSLVFLTQSKKRAHLLSVGLVPVTPERCLVSSQKGILYFFGQPGFVADGFFRLCLSSDCKVSGHRLEKVRGFP